MSSASELRKYQKLTIREHILKRPDSYVGSCSLEEIEDFVVKGDKMVTKAFMYSPAMYKLYDEILVNAMDSATRTGKVKLIEVEVTGDSVSVKNDGPGIPVDIHPDHGIHIPEMIFGNFHTGTNFDDEEERMVGGRNGYGAKLVAVFSKKFVIELVTNGKKYYQEFHNGLSKINKPKITSSKSKDYTKITYFPDFSHFKVKDNTEHLQLYERRAYDVALCSPVCTRVRFCGSEIRVKSMESYVKLFVPPGSKMVTINDKYWQICFMLNETFDKFMQISFVNGIYTKNGGTHVNHIVNPLVKEIIVKLTKGNDGLNIRQSFVKDNILVFIKCNIANPSFDSQTKHHLVLSASKFGKSKFDSTKYVKAVLKLGIDKNVIAMANVKQNKSLLKSDGKKQKRLTNVDNLDDAAHAGTKRSMECKLFITEGLSAKSFAANGISTKDRDRCGIFPIKGKLLNVRSANTRTIANNKEICNIKLALGLRQGLTDLKDIQKNLRYGKMVILTDADSVTENTPILVRLEQKIHVKRIKDLVDTCKFSRGVHEISNGCFLTSCKEYAPGKGYEVWTENGWSPIKHIMRHKVTDKKMYRVDSLHGSVEVTADHSMLTSDGTEIKPNDIKPDTKLMNYMNLDVFENCNKPYGNVIIAYAYFILTGRFYHSCDGVQRLSFSIPNNGTRRFVELLLNTVYGDNVFIHDEYNRILYTQNTGIITVYSQLFLDGYSTICNYIHPDILNMDDRSFTRFYTHFSIIPEDTAGMSEQFRQSLYLLHSRHMYKTNNIANQNDDEITIIESEYTGYVYDLETENHHFQAGVGSLIVHNTDGSHIKGLIVNFIGEYWPQLLKTDFVSYMSTPVVVCTKGSGQKKETAKFYNLIEYDDWVSHTDTSRWSIRYYKGLGTSSDKEAKECFTDYNDKITNLKVTSGEDTNSLSLAFDKDRSDDRKSWITLSTGKRDYLESNIKDVCMSEFINKELVHFSIADCKRSLPNLIDGLKPSQRKVLYGLFLKNTDHPLKFDQFRGYISEHAAYHHGEMSLNGTIYGMNHDFVGSNNINLLCPVGQLGSRLELGADAASPRYVSTRINVLTRLIFKKEDDAIVKYLSDDGMKIEPEHYVPILPILLVNGSVGIATGFATNIPSYNPRDICNILLELMNNLDYQFKLVPWYNKFRGTISESETSEGSWVSKGLYNIVQNKRGEIHISDIPVGVSVSNYRRYLEKLLDEGEIDDFVNRSTGEEIDFTVKMNVLKLKEYIERGIFYKFIGLESIIKRPNINAFDENGILKKYNSPEDVLVAFFGVRRKFYKIRYTQMLKTLKNTMKFVSSRIRFIRGYMNGEIKIAKVAISSLIGQLRTLQFPELNGSYDYLTHMRLISLTMEKIEKLEKELSASELRIRCLENKTHMDLWREDIETLMENLK